MKNIAFLLVVIPFLIQCETTDGYKSRYSSDESHDIKKVMLTSRDKVRACFSGSFPKQPKKYGTLEVQWEINDQGKAQNIKVTKVLHKRVDACIVNVIKEKKFPEAPRGTVVNVKYPFVFKTN